MIDFMDVLGMMDNMAEGATSSEDEWLDALDMSLPWISFFAQVANEPVREVTDIDSLNEAIRDAYRQVKDFSTKAFRDDELMSHVVELISKDYPDFDLEKTATNDDLRLVQQYLFQYKCYVLDADGHGDYQNVWVARR